MRPDEARLLGVELSACRRLLVALLGRVEQIEQAFLPDQTGYVIEVSRVGEKPR